MKRFLFLLVVCLMAYYSGVAHTISHPIVENGKVWSYKAKRLLVSPEYQTEWDEIYSLEGDTVIDSHQCLKLYLTSNCPDKYLPIDYPYTGALYEDGEKVYYIAPNSTTPALLYDFSCESGTIVKVNNFELGINERKLVKYRGEYLTVIAWTPIELDEPDAYTYGYQYYWIEGIGSEIDLMNATPVWYDGGISKYLVTCKLNGQIIYDKDDFLTSAQIVTGLSKSSDSLSDKGNLFDLQGRRLSGKPARGIYIKNGKKILY